MFLPANAVFPYTLKTCETLLESLEENDSEVYDALFLEAVNRYNIRILHSSSDKHNIPKLN